LSVLVLIFGIVVELWTNRAGSNSKPLQTVGVLACTWGGLGIPVCLWLLSVYRKTARRADQIVAGSQTIARWTCSVEEWDRFVRVIAQRSKKNLRVLVIVFGCTGVIATVSMFVAFGGIGHPVHLKMVGFLAAVIAGAILAPFFLCWLAAVYLPARLLRHPTSRDVYIGSEGFVAAGKFTCWQMLGASLKSVRYEPADPGTLVFRWFQPSMAAYGGGAMEGLVPVPKANDADARHVVQFFSDRFRAPA
jgi:hypothetical protein